VLPLFFRDGGGEGGWEDSEQAERDKKKIKSLADKETRRMALFAVICFLDGAYVGFTDGDAFERLRSMDGRDRLALLALPTGLCASVVGCSIYARLSKGLGALAAPRRKKAGFALAGAAVVGIYGSAVTGVGWLTARLLSNGIRPRSAGKMNLLARGKDEDE
jgi:hypothetical protein